jgi:type 1 glutamine amidotransferase
VRFLADTTYKYSDFQKPIDEYKYYCYQAISHNAGLKLPTYGMIQTQQGTRSKEVLSSIFAFMKEREAYAINPRKISQVALVYPKKGIEDVMIIGKKANMGLRNEFLGLYRAMAGKHMQFDILYDHILMEYDLGKYDVVVVPSMVDFNDQEIKTIYQYMKKGGRLVMSDYSYTRKEFTRIPELFQQLTGVKWTTRNGTGNYAVPFTDFYTDQDIIQGPLGIAADKSLPNYRMTEPSNDCKMWLNATLNNVYKGTPEDIGKMERGDNAVLWSKRIGKGDLVYFGNGLGEMMYRYDHPDYTELLFKMIFHEGSFPPLLKTNAPSTVEITMHEAEKGYLFQLVNGTGKTPLDQIIPLSEISITIAKQLPVKGMVYMPGKEGYAIKGIMEQGTTTFTIKQLNDFTEIYIPFD